MWVTDPSTGKPSVSLTILILAVVLMVSAIVLDFFRIAKSTSLLDELFMTSVGLYFGRRMKWGPAGAEMERDNEKKEDSQA